MEHRDRNNEERQADAWAFFVSLYSKPGVESLVLHLQDEHDANVNVILWAQWLEYLGLPLTEKLVSLAQSKIEHWHQQVVVPLRRARKRAKELGAGIGLNKLLKQTELEVEKQEVVLLASVVEDPIKKGLYTKPSIRGQNIRVYLQTLGVTVPEEWINTLSH